MTSKSERDDKSAELEKQRLREDLENILRRVDALPLIDTRSADEITGYGEDGLPR